ncbi:MAG TPA: hypothetical protein PKG52_05985 [bacterium]|nr:hypothetical protein [bacterium]HPS30068.1 hypothetical protein [bacterium]
MKKILFLVLLFSYVLISSCSSSDTGENISGPDIDYDYSNVVTGDESNTNNDNLLTNDESVINDEQISDDDNSEISDSDEEIFHGCGDEIVDYNERCDTIAPISCSDLNPNIVGIAYCSTDCLYYDLGKCERSKGFWGAINLRFETNFILDSAKISDPLYFQKGALPYAAFNGIYGDTKTLIPLPGQNVSYTETTSYQGSLGGIKRQLYIKQNPVVGGSIGYPRMELEFSPGAISNGAEYKINAVTIFDLVDNYLKLVRFRLIEKQNGAECIMGIGYSGSVYITNIFPENADLFDGGSIEVVSNNIDFYYPTEVPGLDENNPEVPAEILKYSVCSK